MFDKELSPALPGFLAVHSAISPHHMPKHSASSPSAATAARGGDGMAEGVSGGGGGGWSGGCGAQQQAAELGLAVDDLGLAVFLRKDMFEIVSVRSVELRSLLPPDRPVSSVCVCARARFGM